MDAMCGHGELIREDACPVEIPNEPTTTVISAITIASFDSLGRVVFDMVCNELRDWLG